MTITRVQGNARGTANSGSTLTVSLTNTPTQGNTLICVFGGFLGGTIDTINQTGVTWARAINNPYGGCNITEIWAGNVTSTSASTSLTITLTSNLLAYGFADVCEYHGLSTEVDKTSTDGGMGTGTASTGTTETTIYAHELFIGATWGIRNGSGAVTQSNPQNGFSLLDGANGITGSYNTSLAYLEKIVYNLQTAWSSTSFQSSANYSGCIATFKAKTSYDIVATASPNCSISPSGIVSAVADEDQTFTITADSGYHVAHVYVDNVDQGALSTYTFNDVDAPHTIFAVAEFNPSTYNITAVADTNSSISPSGTISVNAGDDQQFTISVNSGYHINHVYVDYTDQGTITTYTFTNVNAAHSIFVTSEANTTALDVNGNLTVSGNTDIEGDLQATAYKANDGTAGETNDLTLSGVTTLHFKNGLFVGAI